MPGEGVTQRDLLEQNTTLTKMVYEAVGRVSDQLTGLDRRVSRIEGRQEGKEELDQKRVRHSNLDYWKISLASSSVLSVVAMVIGLTHG